MNPMKPIKKVGAEEAAKQFNVEFKREEKAIYDAKDRLAKKQKARELSRLRAKRKAKIYMSKYIKNKAEKLKMREREANAAAEKFNAEYKKKHKSSL